MMTTTQGDEEFSDKNGLSELYKLSVPADGSPFATVWLHTNFGILSWAVRECRAIRRYFIEPGPTPDPTPVPRKV